MSLSVPDSSTSGLGGGGDHNKKIYGGPIVKQKIIWNRTWVYTVLGERTS
jgi:hypothetical protein